MAQQKLYRLGQKQKSTGKTVASGVQQGKTSGKQLGKTHAVKNRVVNHNRGTR